MSKKKTSTFYLTERMTLTASGTPVLATIDLGAYVDVADRQAIAVEEIDIIYQGKSPGSGLNSEFTTDATIFAQVTDLNRGGVLVFADDRALIGSGSLSLDQGANVLSHSSDMYPDVMGANEGVRLVVNDQLYCIAEAAGTFGANREVNVTVRVKAHVRTLTAKDWMAIAIQSTAADN